MQYYDIIRLDEFYCFILHVQSLRSAHSRGVSSLSHALDSIASCSDEEEGSDEETGSSYYDSESYSNTTESTKKVWNQGKSLFPSIIN